MIRGREANSAPPTDLLVCFPKRAHLTLMPPKSIGSPARPSEASKRHHNGRHVRNKSMPRVGIGRGGQFNSWERNTQSGVENGEPTSPKVTCAGQVKVRHQAAATCKSWQSVIHEFEKIHIKEKRRKRTTLGYFAFKKDILSFLTCMRSIRFDFRCFGAFPRHEVSSDDDDEEGEDDDDEDHVFNDSSKESHIEGSRTEFSKWYMVFHTKNQTRKEANREAKGRLSAGDEHDNPVAPTVPPSNALFLMRCRSAPARSWLEGEHNDDGESHKEETEDDREGEDIHSKVEKILQKGKKLKTLMEEEERLDMDQLVMMRYEARQNKISSKVNEETWVVGSMRYPLARSRSWRG